jgi:putative DNA primase/helicase
MAQIAKDTRIYTPITFFDQSHDHVNCLNGVIDLSTGRIEAHDPKQLYTYCLNVEYHPDAGKPKEFLSFLNSCGLEQDVVDYLQISLGYSLTGHTSEEVMFYLYGKTRSGKGTTMETINDLFGTLSTGVDMETFTSKRYGDTSNFDLAPLKAKRFITASESQRRGQLNPAFIKKVTGGDEIYCSFKRRDHFSYRPQFKIWLTSNFEANTDVDDDAAWGRLRVLKFPLTFLGNEDKTLKKRLKKTLSKQAIFAWVVQGAQLWYEMRGSGLPMPESVRVATEEHRQLLDTVAQFIDESCLQKADAFTVGSTLYSAYKKWCEDEGHTPVGRKRFTQSLSMKGIETEVKHVGGKSQRVYDGVGLLV